MDNIENKTKNYISNRIGLREYIRRQNEAGSCIKQFKEMMIKGFQIGGVFGLCIGPYLCYRYYFFIKLNKNKNFRFKVNKSIKQCASLILFSTIGSITAFSGATFTCSIFNCMIVDEKP